MNPRTPHRDEKTMFNKIVLNYSVPVIVPLPSATVNGNKGRSPQTSVHCLSKSGWVGWFKFGWTTLPVLIKMTRSWSWKDRERGLKNKTCPNQIKR